PPQVRARLPDVAGGAQVLRGRVRIGVLPALGQGLALARLRVLGLLRALAVEADLDARIRGPGQEARGQPRLPLLEVVAGDYPFGDRLRRGTDLVRVLPVLCLLRPVAPLRRVHTEQQLVVIGFASNGVAFAARGTVEFQGEHTRFGGVLRDRVGQFFGIEPSGFPVAGDHAGAYHRVLHLLDAGCPPCLARLPAYDVLLLVRVTSDRHRVRVVGDDVLEFLRIV